MKRNFILMLVATVASLTYCTSARKAVIAAHSISYEKNIQAVVATSCSPCHLPSKGGKKPPLESYTDVAYNIDEIIRRIELHPGEKGFMPAKHDRLSDSTINLFKSWKRTGMTK
ncbi:MAG: cytochrome c [Chitinophagaceae bacterium]|nr:MAG: cytochrome c [Chitinophagaceae bacterium]